MLQNTCLMEQGDKLRTIQKVYNSCTDKYPTGKVPVTSLKRTSIRAFDMELMWT